LRRGHETVHEKWNINTGIYLVMLILAYQYFEQYEPFFRDLAKLFSKTALEVCEGQQWMLILKIVQMLPFLNI
jgi:geranylgeranyl diphosphate synthase type II